MHVPFEKVPATFVAVVGLTLHTGAYLSEIFRAALQSVPKGQMEAAQAIGMTWFQAFRRSPYCHKRQSLHCHYLRTNSLTHEKY